MIVTASHPATHRRPLFNVVRPTRVRPNKGGSGTTEANGTVRKTAAVVAVLPRRARRCGDAVDEGEQGANEEEPCDESEFGHVSPTGEAEQQQGREHAR